MKLSRTLVNYLHRRLIILPLAHYFFKTIKHVFNTCSFNVFSTEDMSFEFKKAFAKATELRSLTFSQQWTMTDESIFTTESPVSMALFNVPPGYTHTLCASQKLTYAKDIQKTMIYSRFSRSCTARGVSSRDPTKAN